MTSGNSGFVPPLKLIQGTSREVNQKVDNLQGQRVNLAPGMFYFQPKNLTFGERVNISVISHRLHVIAFNGDKKVEESYNKESPIFKRMWNAPDTNEYRVSKGYEWLVWLADIGEVATFFPGRPSAREVSRSIHDYITKPDLRETDSHKELPYTNCFELYADFKKWKSKSSWVPYVTAIEPKPHFMPSEDIVKNAVALFMSPVINEPKYEEAPSNSVER